MRVYFLSLFFLLTTLLFASDSLRGRPAGSILPNMPPINFGIDDLIEVTLPMPTPLYSALVITLTIPREFLPHRNSFALVLATNLRPRYRTDFSDYLVSRLGSQILPLSQTFTIRVPLVPNTRLPATRNSWDLSNPIPPQSGNLALIIIPMDKDLPPNTQRFQFTIATRLLPGTHGGLKMNLPELDVQELKNVKIKWGGVTLPWAEVIYLLPGRQELSVLDSPVNYETVQLEISPGLIQEITLKPLDTDSYFVWDVPPEVKIEVNGNVVPSSQPLKVTPGVYRIVLRLGSNTMSRLIEVNRPGRFLVSLELELKIDGN